MVLHACSKINKLTIKYTKQNRIPSHLLAFMNRLKCKLFINYLLIILQPSELSPVVTAIQGDKLEN